MTTIVAEVYLVGALMSAIFVLYSNIPYLVLNHLPDKEDVKELGRNVLVILFWPITLVLSVGIVAMLSGPQRES